MTTLTTQDNDTSAGTLADLAGRVLSKKSRQIVEDALAALKNLISYADKTGEEMPDEEDEPVMDMTAELSSGGYVVELGLTQGKPFAGFALGKFVDMHGRAVEFAKDSISEFLSNTIKAIDAAKAKRMPGLPIDAQKHDKGEAAGWIVSAELGEVTDSGGDSIPAIYLVAEWTSLGVRLLSDKILTNFSPTVDLTNKTIRGGSLTNWPASVDAKGVPLFNAVELQAQSQTSDHPVMDDLSQTDKPNSEVIMKLDELTQEQRESLLAEARQAALAEMAKGGNGNGTPVDLSALADVTDLAGARDALLAQYQSAIKAEYARMQQQAGAQLANMMAEMKKGQHIAEFSQRITGGSETNQRGLPVKADELETVLSQLPDPQRQAVESILTRTWESGLVDFSELGHGKRPQGGQQLDPAVKRLLKEHVANGGTVEAFFSVAEIGDMGNYNLSEFEGGK